MTTPDDKFIFDLPEGTSAEDIAHVVIGAKVEPETPDSDDTCDTV